MAVAKKQVTKTKSSNRNNYNKTRSNASNRKASNASNRKTTNASNRKTTNASNRKKTNASNIKKTKKIGINPILTKKHNQNYFNNEITSIFSCIVAWSNAVFPLLSFIDLSAPAFKREVTISGFPKVAAKIKLEAPL